MAGTKGRWNGTEKQGCFLGVLWTAFDMKLEKYSTYLTWNQNAFTWISEKQ